jgi:hypothetical protein
MSRITYLPQRRTIYWVGYRRPGNANELETFSDADRSRVETFRTDAIARGWSPGTVNVTYQPIEIPEDRR